MFLILTILLALSMSSHGSRESLETINGEKCTTIYTMGYGYQNWYNATEIPAANASVTGAAMFKFYVQGTSNAHIMLAREPSSFGYEIVIGAGSNTFCDIRKFNGVLTSVVTVFTEKILDMFNPIGFWVRATQQSGLIEVGKFGESLPFIFWIDPEPIPIKYYSFTSWGAAICKWMFRCKPDSFTVMSRTERTDYTKKFFTSTEQLRRDVLKKRGPFGSDPTTNPQQVLSVAITNNFKFIHLDVMTSILTIQGTATFEWTDNSINWNPQNYKNISKLHLSNYELWQPELVLHNAMDPAVNMYSESKISVDNNGQVIWRPKFYVKTKCDIDLTLWPWDKHKCTLLLSTWSHKVSNVFYEIKDDQKSECLQISHSDWKLDRVTSFYVEDRTPWDDIMESMNGISRSVEDPSKDSLKLVLKISRNTKIFEKLFYAPLILISCIWLSSFGVMPNSSSKITTICVSIILSTLIVVYMTKYVPVFTKFPPDLMLGYLKLLLLISMDAFISSLLITVHNRKSTSGHPPFALTRFLTTPIVTKLLVLPKLDSTRSLVNNQLDHRLTGVPETTTTLWDIVIVAFERIIFIVFLATTVTILLSIKFSITALF
ncbi:neuronal acetylcholine receptor subunit beta-4-like [Rhopalosiphum padi]|uniref:neuronal acetylcholine receptor subunit beta-4-like n=1 Tax=Rhopalosiphum padi TaxID=40932 RepID=UPI00298E8E74|nr:neuronal acetylcholine receptor subunit beta-4-like [Rhopalosiphum padi]